MADHERRKPGSARDRRCGPAQSRPSSLPTSARSSRRLRSWPATTPRLTNARVSASAYRSPVWRTWCRTPNGERWPVREPTAAVARVADVYAALPVDHRQVRARVRRRAAGRRQGRTRRSSATPSDRSSTGGSPTVDTPSRWSSGSISAAPSSSATPRSAAEVLDQTGQIQGLLLELAEPSPGRSREPTRPPWWPRRLNSSSRDSTRRKISAGTDDVAVQCAPRRGAATGDAHRGPVRSTPTSASRAARRSITTKARMLSGGRRQEAGRRAARRPTIERYSIPHGSSAAAGMNVDGQFWMLAKPTSFEAVSCLLSPSYQMKYRYTRYTRRRPRGDRPGGARLEAVRTAARERLWQLRRARATTPSRRG